LRNYYDMLSIERGAPADEIKKAFRREIARYHPDKVQHLGQEFQEMASGIAADLTEAYRILMDPSLRAKYDADLSGDGAAAAVIPPPAAAPQAPPRPPADPSPSPAPDAGAAARPTAGSDFVKRAAISKLRDAIAEEMPLATAVTAPGFDLAVAAKPKKALFKKAEDAVCVLVKFVPRVDVAAIEQFWPAATKVRAPESKACVLMLVGPGLAPAKELAAAISDLRRRARTPGPVLVPIDVRDWDALFPPDTPTAVRNVVQRLKDEKR
jgi:hypothetical protein